MTKSQIIDKIKAARDWNHFHVESEGWADAMMLYNAVHGLSAKEGLRMNCSRCFREAKEWLELKEK